MCCLKLGLDLSIKLCNLGYAGGFDPQENDWSSHWRRFEFWTALVPAARGRNPTIEPALLAFVSLLVHIWSMIGVVWRVIDGVTIDLTQERTLGVHIEVALLSVGAEDFPRREIAFFGSFVRLIDQLLF